MAKHDPILVAHLQRNFAAAFYSEPQRQYLQASQKALVNVRRLKQKKQRVIKKGEFPGQHID